MYSNKKNNAQRARENSNYVDRWAKKVTERTHTGGEVDVTRYSDGSSTYHFGGMGGNQDYDKFGEEC